MTTKRYDAIVAGLGVMGSATAWALARRGLRVLGLEQFTPRHDRGSSHGESRIIRELYFEHPMYVPLVQRAYTLWAELESETEAELLALNGGLTFGPANGRIVSGARQSAHDHGLRYEELTPEAVTERFPAIRPPADYLALWDPRGGYVRADRAIQAFRAVALRQGAELRYGERMVAWATDGRGVTVTTDQGRYQADHLVLCLGPWIAKAIRDLNVPLVIERQVLVWFEPLSASDSFAEGHLPIFVYEHGAGRTVYGFPRLGGRVKAALFHDGLPVSDPDVPQPDVHPSEIDALRDALTSALPMLAVAPVRASTTCLFTNTPDSRFVLGRHPTHPHVLLCSPCSGHGFKFAPVIGEINAGLVAGDASPFDLSVFRPARFTGGP